MKYVTYILISSIINKTYVGHTNDLEIRLRKHNSGRSVFTNKYKPWQVLYTEEFEDKSEAVKREKYFKSGAGRRWIKQNLFKSE